VETIYTSLGRRIKDLREQGDLSRKEVTAAINPFFSYEIRSLQRIENGERRPNRHRLIVILAVGIGEKRVAAINDTLALAKYSPLTFEEVDKYKLISVMQTAEPQVVSWGPKDGKPAGISTEPGGFFMPWEELKLEIELKLLNQLGRHIPPNCRVVLDDFRGRKDWLARIVGPDAKFLGDIWFGPDPDKQWAFDGLVRVGEAGNDDVAVVWQTFQRYSDGTYRRIKAMH
jgi:hypothetical protein